MKDEKILELRKELFDISCQITFTNNVLNDEERAILLDRKKKIKESMKRYQFETAYGELKEQREMKR